MNVFTWNYEKRQPPTSSLAKLLVRFNIRVAETLVRIVKNDTIEKNNR
jgi:hypothetical protein